MGLRGAHKFVAWALAGLCLACPLIADTARATPAVDAFAQHCFSPLLTADKARAVFALPGLSHDFYDLAPFSAAAPSPAKGDVTEGTDRRCEVSFLGDHTVLAVKRTTGALTREGITQRAILPARYSATPRTALLEARRLNPRKIAVVHVGTRDGAKGTETFLRVERLRITVEGQN